MFLSTGSMWLDIIAVIVALFTVIYTYLKWVYHTWQRKNVPYFQPTIPFGNLQPLYKEVPFSDDIFNIVKKAKTKGWKYFGMYLTVNPVFVPLDLDLVKNILTKDFHNFGDRGSYYNEKDDPLSAHLFALGGKKWKNLRTKLTPTFTSGKLKAMFSTVTGGCSVLEKTLEEHDKNEPLDIKEVLVGYTMDTFGSCAFGIDSNNIKKYDTPFRIYSKKMFERTKFEQLCDFFTGSFPKLALALRVTVVNKDISEFFYEFVSSTVGYREKNNYTRNDFLQLLIDMKNKTGGQSIMHEGDGLHLTLDEIVAQSFLFFLAGYETTSTTMTFAMYELSRHPEEQEKVREELLKVLKKYDNTVSYDTLKDLKYMEQVIDETLRKYPPLPQINRRCVQNYKVPNSDLILEKGHNILIPIRNIHYDENIYEDPEKFDPERFSPEQKERRHPYAHIPFGEGPRICIGLRFAMMEIKLTLLKMLSKYRITLNPKTVTPLQMNPKTFVPLSKEGIWLNLEKL